MKKYVQRPQTPYEHAWEIRDRYGYRSFDDQGCAGAFARFLEGRAWTHVEGPVALFDQAAGWLRRNRVLLPGVTVLAAQIPIAQAWGGGLLASVASVHDEDVARLSPLGHAHLNCLGRYAFTTQPPAELRPLRDPNARDSEDDGEL